MCVSSWEGPNGSQGNLPEGSVKGKDLTKLDYVKGDMFLAEGEHEQEDKDVGGRKFKKAGVSVGEAEWLARQVGGRSGKALCII